MSNPALLVGYDSSDDAAVYRVSDEVAVIETVDFFTPIVDDPYLFGQIAAANALSDVYAMGGEPKLAMNLLCVPNCLPKEDIRAILEGGHAKAVEAGCVIAGGHTIQDNEPSTACASRDSSIPTASSKMSARSRAMCWCSPSRSAAACSRPPSKQTSSPPPPVTRFMPTWRRSTKRRAMPCEAPKTSTPAPT